mmetsp:Transcript_108589/g.231928  ORF Transcript_108589/g.231928 Transcript_108589/m.231928 type:complete len:635 (+) Transcript_108589:146-2050(+)
MALGAATTSPLAESKSQASVTVVVAAETALGERVRLVGAPEEWGSWRPGEGLPLFCPPQRRCAGTAGLSVVWWATSVRIPPGASSADLEYKFAIMRAGGEVIWEPSVRNRKLDASASHGLVLARFGHEGMPLVDPGKPISSKCCLVLCEAICSFTQPGDSLVVVGSTSELGNWNPKKGFRLSTDGSIFPRWCGAICLLGTSNSRAGDASRARPVTSWKFVIERSNGLLDWELGDDRTFTLPSGEDGVQACHLSGRFGDTFQRPLPQTLNVGEISASCTNSAMTPDAKASGLEAASSEEAILPRPPSSLSTCSTGLEDDCGDSPYSVPPSPQPPGSWLWSGGHGLAKAFGAGEDAHFIGHHALGVADGVGSMSHFSRHGVDAAAYAAELMELAAAALSRSDTYTSASAPSKGVCMRSPDDRAQAAVATAAAEATTLGASTITVLELQRDNIGVASLGDSGFMVLRRRSDDIEIVARSQEQQHSWNCPYQLTRLPSSLACRIPKGRKLDSAADCQRYQVLVCPGDLVLLFTDGFSDNMHDHEILAVLSQALAEQEASGPHTGLGPAAGTLLPRPESLARQLAIYAQSRSLDPAASVPFNLHSQQQGHPHDGGKEDDITVVAAWVMPEAADMQFFRF